MLDTKVQEITGYDVEYYARRLPRRVDIYDVNIAGADAVADMVGYSFTRGNYKITIVSVFPVSVAAGGVEVGNVAVEVEPKTKDLRNDYAAACAFYDLPETLSSSTEFVGLWAREGAMKLFTVKSKKFGFFLTSETGFAIDTSGCRS